MKDDEFELTRHWLDRPLDECNQEPLPMAWRVIWFLLVLSVMGMGLWAWVTIIRWLA